VKRCDDGRLQDFLLGGLTLEQLRETQLHLDGCVSCRRSIDELRRLFHALEEQPYPPVPAGIAGAVLARLQQETALGRARRRIAAFVRRPAAAAVSGSVVGLGIALFQDSLWRLLARVLGGLLSGWATTLIATMQTMLERFVSWTASLDTSVHWMVKLRALARVLGEAVRLVPAEFPLLAAALGLLFLLVVLRRVATMRREKLGHVEN
jgi:hypothetical protein